MKKTIYILLIVISSFIYSKPVIADYDALMNEKNTFSNIVDKYNDSGLNLSLDSDTDAKGFTYKLKTYLLSALNSEISSSLYILIVVSLICIIVSVSNNFISDNFIQEAASFGCYTVISYLIVVSFKTVFDYCVSAMSDITDFMDITIPTFMTVLASSGYETTAVSIQSVFLIMSSFISHIIKNTIMPVLFVTGVLGVVNGMSYDGKLTKLITLVSKTSKYTIGIILTVFAGILTFSGFGTSSADSLMIRTAKYAVSSFVPIVGSCLSDTLSTVVSSSAALKNQMGYICFIILILICLMPIVKTAVLIFMFKFCASISMIISNNKVPVMIDSVSECLITICSMLLFVSVVFVIVIGIIASVGG